MNLRRSWRLTLRSGPATAPASQDLEFCPRDQAAVDLISAPELVALAVVLGAPVFRQVIPSVESLAGRTVAMLVRRQITLELGLRGVDRDHVEGRLVTI